MHSFIFKDDIHKFLGMPEQFSKNVHISKILVRGILSSYKLKLPSRKFYTKIFNGFSEMLRRMSFFANLRKFNVTQIKTHINMNSLIFVFKVVLHH